MSVPSPRPRPVVRSRRGRKLLALTSLGLAGLLAGLLSGCSSLSQAENAATTAANNFSAVTGNWQFASNAGGGGLELAGALSVDGSQITGRLHTLAGTCNPAAGASFAVVGAVTAENGVALTGQDADGHSFEISGVLAADQHSLVNPSVTVSGACVVLPETRTVRPRGGNGGMGQQYQAVEGNYTGSFSDSEGDTIPVSATLSQPTTPDANGVYHLTGSATFASEPCIGSPVVTSSTVSGSQLSATYTDNASGATVTATGTFSSDAQTLTITSWTLTGSCGSDNGTGLLNHQ